MRTARNRGYLDASLTRRELIVNPADLTADARITLDTGGRYEFGAIEIEQDSIDAELLQGYIRFAQGQPYSPAELHNTQYALEDSNYFSSVIVTPGERDAETSPCRCASTPNGSGATGMRSMPVTARIPEVRGQFAWDNRLINTRGHRSRVELTASEQRSEASGRYVIPIGDPSLEKLEFQLAYIDEDIGDLTSERVELTGGMTRVIGRWQQVLFLRLNNETTGYPGRQRRQPAAADPGHQLCQPAAQLPDRMGPRRGLLLRAVRQPGNAGVRRLVPAFLFARGARVADQGAVLPAHPRRIRHELGQTSSPSCRRHSAFSPVATAACAASPSTH